MQFTCFLEAKLKATHFTCTFLYIMIVAGIIAGGANAGELMLVGLLLVELMLVELMD